MKDSAKTKKFNIYLKKIGGLNNGFYTDRPPIMSRDFFSIGDGWLKIVQKLIEDCLKLGWDKEICQVKEKLGGIRFYTNNMPEGMHELILKAEDLSFNTCAVCGKPGKLMKGKSGWFYTSCKKHKDK